MRKFNYDISRVKLIFISNEQRKNLRIIEEKIEVNGDELRTAICNSYRFRCNNFAITVCETT